MEISEPEQRRLALIINERRKLLANGLDRLSTAFIAVGVLGQALSLTPAAATLTNLIVMAGWISGAVILHLVARRVLGGLRI